MNNINPWENIIEIRKFNQKKFGKICEMKSSFDMTIGLIFQAILRKVFDFGREKICICIKEYTTNASGNKQVSVVMDENKFKFYGCQSSIVFDRIKKELTEYGIPFTYSYGSKNKSWFIEILLN